jgi:hypothetical protein
LPALIECLSSLKCCSCSLHWLLPLCLYIAFLYWTYTLSAHLDPPPLTLSLSAPSTTHNYADDTLATARKNSEMAQKLPEMLGNASPRPLRSVHYLCCPTMATMVFGVPPYSHTGYYTRHTTSTAQLRLLQHLGCLLWTKLACGHHPAPCYW